MKKLLSLAAVVVLMSALGENVSRAQYFDAYSGLSDIAASNMSFDAQFWSQLNAMQQQNYQQAEQLMQQVMAHPQVLAALNPVHGLRFFLAHGVHGFLILGAVVLCITGSGSPG